MNIDIDRHILSEMVEIDRKLRQEMNIIDRHYNIIKELEGERRGLIQHLVKEVKLAEKDKPKGYKLDNT